MGESVSHHPPAFLFFFFPFLSRSASWKYDKINRSLPPPPKSILLALGRTTPATDYLMAQKLRRCLVMHLSHLWYQHPGMLIITPTTACAGWRIRNKAGELKVGLSDGDKTIESMRYVWMANFCGVPSISVPAGYASPDAAAKGAGLRVAEKGTVGKVPVGLMAMGEWAGEKALVEFGVEAERVGAEGRERPGRWVDVIEAARTQVKSSE